MAAPEAHHQILCAVIKHKCPEYQIVSQPTLHNVLLSTIPHCALKFGVPEQ